MYGHVGVSLKGDGLWVGGSKLFLGAGSSGGAVNWEEAAAEGLLLSWHLNIP